MTDHPDEDLQHVLECSAGPYEALHAILGDSLEVETHRDLLTQGTCSIAIEHGVSVWVLVEAGNLASAIALQRPQLEAVVRALWLHDVATDEWIERYFAAVKANPMKDPNFSPPMGEMNSYVHSGIHPIVQHHAGYPPEYAIQALRNSNGLAGMAATLMAMMTGDPVIATGVRDAQLAHLDCLPPLETPPPTEPSPP